MGRAKSSLKNKTQVAATHIAENAGFFDRAQDRLFDSPRSPRMTVIVNRYWERAGLQKWRRMRPVLAIAWAFALSVIVASHAQNGKRPPFEILTRRMDVDVDGAPNAYGPPGMQTLDIPLNAHYLNRADKEIVGYLIDEHGRPIVQGPGDPFPGYYISETAFTDLRNRNERDPRRYVDARNINYVVRGDVASRRGVSYEAWPEPGFLRRFENQLIRRTKYLTN